ncbi:PadR family transcriptional regulator [Williamsia limnetica]|uniref:PadR family transcriptional regulator n=1 Tax=Williamsia limnetica TaxID=882452 RepID=A0A318RHF9_WILLI|nr:PadR family transcriptional regulator [Williamsia limnetica]PYE14353.1 PadR family transcriptional regulator [Williamsia limnetica]
MLSFGEELTGNDLKKWADWSIGFFYWSPSVSQVYAELKKLESLGLVNSRTVVEVGARGRRLYAITDTGTEALRDWSRDAKVEMPVLKHGVMLRLWMGHLLAPERLKMIVKDHIANLEHNANEARRHAEHSNDEPAWAFSRMSLRWADRHFQAEIRLAEQLLDDIDEAAQWFRDESETSDNGRVRPRHPGRWREAEESDDGTA